MQCCRGGEEGTPNYYRRGKCSPLVRGYHRKGLERSVCGEKRLILAQLFRSLMKTLQPFPRRGGPRSASEEGRALLKGAYRWATQERNRSSSNRGGRKGARYRQLEVAVHPYAQKGEGPRGERRQRCLWLLIKEERKKEAFDPLSQRKREGNGPRSSQVKKKSP